MKMWVNTDILSWRLSSLIYQSVSLGNRQTTIADSAGNQQEQMQGSQMTNWNILAECPFQETSIASVLQEEKMSSSAIELYLHLVFLRAAIETWPFFRKKPCLSVSLLPALLVDSWLFLLDWMTNLLVDYWTVQIVHASFDWGLWCYMFQVISTHPIWSGRKGVLWVPLIKKQDTEKQPFLSWHPPSEYHSSRNCPKYADFS